MQFHSGNLLLMFRFAAAVAFCGVVVPPSFANPLVIETPPLTPAEQQQKFHLPPGFSIQLVASEPDIGKPMNMAFDAAGRLWVTHSWEYPFPAKDSAAARDAITIFSQFDTSGKATQVARFADHLNIPIGLVPLSNSEVLAWSIPHIYRLTDTNGDGIADSKSPAFGPFGFTDTHGNQNAFRHWIDGWVYANHGYSNTSEVRRGGTGDVVMKLHSGNTYRFKADGSRIEQFTWGQVNPFGSSFDPLGNLFTADCHSRPVTMVLRGGYYQSFGKPHDGVGFAPEATTIDHGGTGISGIAYSTSPHFPDDFRDVLFVGNVITNRVHCDRLIWAGSTPTVEKVEDFITCDDAWFRPVDIQQGPDGALYIADFYNCIIGHYEVPLDHPKRDRTRGRIWRVVYTGVQPETKPQPTPELPNIAGLTIEQLSEQLSDKNLTVRTLATNELAARPVGEVLPAMRQLLETAKGPPTDADLAVAQAHALWIVERLAGLSQAEVTTLFASHSEIVRVHLMRALAERERCNDDCLAIMQTATKLDFSFQVRRAAADALGQHPHPGNLPALATALTEAVPHDVAFIHTCRMALRNQFRDAAVAQSWPHIRGQLSAAQKQSLLELAAVADTSDAANLVWNELLDTDHAAPALVELLPRLAKHVPVESFGPMVELIGQRLETEPQRRLQLLSGMRQSLAERRLTPPTSLDAKLEKLLAERLTLKDAAAVTEAAGLAARLKLLTLATVVGQQASSAAAPIESRLACCEALLDLDAAAAVDPLAKLLANEQVPPAERERATALLGRVDREQARLALVTALRTAPVQLAVAIATQLATRPASGELLLVEIESGRAPATLLKVPQVADRMPLDRINDGPQRVANLIADLPAADQRIIDLIAQRKQGYQTAKPDANRGAQVFAKSVCANCHRVGELGKNLGPGLDGIGVRGLDRLLEDILNPSQNVDQSFRTVMVATDDGQIFSGFGLREEDAHLILHDHEGKTRRVPLEEITDRRTSNLSPMPSGAIEQIPEPDFYDLLAFLLSQRAMATKQ